jgi:O-glycosyl hydrolase
VTSDSQQLAAQAAVTITDGAFTATLPARSVTSLVGTFMP